MNDDIENKDNLIPREGLNYDPSKKPAFCKTPYDHPEYAMLAMSSGELTRIKLPHDGAQGIVRVVNEAFNGSITAIHKHALKLFTEENIRQAKWTLGQVDVNNLQVRMGVKKHASELSVLSNYFLLAKHQDWDLDNPQFSAGMRLRLTIPASDFPKGGVPDKGTPTLIVLRPFTMAAIVAETIATHALYSPGETHGWNGKSLWQRYNLVIEYLEFNGYVTTMVPALHIECEDFLHSI